MDLSKHMKDLLVLDRTKMRADERLTYCFEKAEVGRIYWEILAAKLAEFYFLCGYDRYVSMVRLNPLLIAVRQLYERDGFEPLPVQNPVALFHRLAELDGEIPKNQCRVLMCALLPYALAGNGLSFGTAFDRKGVRSVRPCDMDYAEMVFPDVRIHRNLLISQAQLHSDQSFEEEYTKYTAALNKLERQRNLVLHWRKNWEEKSGSVVRPKPWQGDRKRREDMFFDFLALYEDYCMSQAASSVPKQRREIKRQIEQIRLSGQFIFEMERINARLMEITSIKDLERNWELRRQWVEETQKTLHTDEAVAQLKAMEECFPDEFKELTNSAPVFLYLSKGRGLGYIPSLLDEKTVFGRLQPRERQDLYWYRQYPVGKWIDRLYRGPAKAAERLIMPFYLSFYFTHRGKPLRPFKRFAARFVPEKLPFGGAIAFSTHTVTMRNQQSHFQLYQSLIHWCSKYFPETVDVKVSHALYTFYRPYLATKSPSAKNQEFPNDLYVLYQGLLRIFAFPVSMLPQYTDEPITEPEFYHFFFADAAFEIRAIRRRLKEAVTAKSAEEYRQKAFLSGVGFGYSLYPTKWHCDIADWLTEIINGSEALKDFVDQDPSNLGKVEVALQYLCCDWIRQTEAQQALCHIKYLLAP